METYVLEKIVWTHEDFDVMGWHDSKLWGFLANPDAWEFLIDLDYIFKWVTPKDDEGYYRFWISPVTMVFENVSDVKLNIDSRQGEIEIANLNKESLRELKNNNLTEYAFCFECQEGEITLKATGYKMYVRQSPKLTGSQSFSFEERKGIDFSRVMTS